MMCKGIDQSYNPLYPTNIFTQQDDSATTWSRYTDITEEVEVKTEWYEPNGSLYCSDTYSISDPGVGYYYSEIKQWSWIYINDYSAANKCGNWIIKKYEKDVYGNWDLLYDDNFMILETPNVIPYVSITIQPENPIEGENISLYVNGSDNTYIDEISLYWNDGTLHSQTWSNIYYNNFNNNKDIGRFDENDEIEIWAKILDTSGNLYESTHETITVGDSDTDGPIISNVSVTEYNGNGNGIIAPFEEIKIECDVNDISGISEVHFFVDTNEVFLDGNYFSYCGPYNEGSHYVTITAIDNDNSPAYTTYFGDFTVESLTIQLDIKVFLEGPYNATSGIMSNSLNPQFLPLSQPYNNSPWNYDGNESILSIPNSNIVDWILIELRDAPGDASTATGSTYIGKRAAFLLNNGNIVDLDGISFLQLNDIIIWHC